jgi:hypothetical protein
MNALKEQPKQNKLPLYELFFIIGIYVMYLLPSVSLSATVVLGILVLYSGYVVLTQKEFIPILFKLMMLVAVIALFYTLLTDTFTISSNASNLKLKQFFSKFYQYFSLYFPLILLMRVNSKASLKQKKLLMIAALVLMAYVIVTTWIFLVENPNATREWGGFDETKGENVANYYFIYAVPMIIAIFASCMVKLSAFQKVFSFAIIAVSLVFLVNAQYTLSLLISFVGILYQIFKSLGSSLSKLIFVVALIAMLFFVPQILELLINNIKSDQVTTRLSEIYDFLTGKGAGGYNLNGRLTLYGETIKTFFQSPIVGNRDIQIDGHATFLTILSDTGLLGGIPFYYLFYTVCKWVKEETGKNNEQIKVIILMFTLMGLTNPVHSSMPLGFATWFLAPLMIITIFNKGEQKHETTMGN